MYLLTNDKDATYIHIQCGCGRKFRTEEMYICYNCNKILCRYCLSEEIEYLFCKNYCKRNQVVSVNSANELKRLKNSCNYCLECPSCQIALVKRFSDGKYYYVCPYCYWDTSNIKFQSAREAELDGLIYQLKEQTTKGYLKKMYDHSLNKLKSTLGQTEAGHTRSRSTLRTSFGARERLSDVTYDVNKAMDARTWEYEDLERKLEQQNADYRKKKNLQYDDNYYQNKDFSAFPAVNNFLACNTDYGEKYSLSKLDSIDSLKDKLKNELDFSFISSYEHRLSNICSQHYHPHVYFPEFVPLIPKKSKRCKTCKKFIVQAEEITKKQSQKLELCHLFLNQFPCVFVYKVDKTQSVVLLKFVMLDFKETKINFKEYDCSPVKVFLPTGYYDITESSSDNNKDGDDFIYSKGDRMLILTFKYDENTCQEENNIMKFYINAEYNRLTTNMIEYLVEIKFKLS